MGSFQEIILSGTAGVWTPEWTPIQQFKVSLFPKLIDWMILDVWQWNITWDQQSSFPFLSSTPFPISPLLSVMKGEQTEGEGAS